MLANALPCLLGHARFCADKGDRQTSPAGEIEQDRREGCIVEADALRLKAMQPPDRHAHAEPVRRHQVELFE